RTGDDGALSGVELLVRLVSAVTPDTCVTADSADNSGNGDTNVECRVLRLCVLHLPHHRGPRHPHRTLSPAGSITSNAKFCGGIAIFAAELSARSRRSSRTQRSAPAGRGGRRPWSGSGALEVQVVILGGLGLGQQV